MTSLPPSKRGFVPDKTDLVGEAKRKFASGKIAFHYEGFPTMKFGYDKFICTRINSDTQALEFIIGDFTTANPPGPAAKWTLGEKHIFLTNDQFMRLVGLIYNNITTLIRDPQLTSGNLSTLFHLGNDVYFVWSSYDSVALANIRQFCKRGNGDMQATKNGVSFGIKSFESLRTTIQDLSMFKDINALLKARGSLVIHNEPTAADFSSLLAGLPFTMYGMWLDRLHENCARCGEMVTLFTQPTVREASHACEWGLGTLNLTDEMMNDIITELGNGKRLIGMMLLLRPWGQLTGFDDILGFNAKQFLDQHKDTLWESVKRIAMEKLKITEIGDGKMKLPIEINKAQEGNSGNGGEDGGV